MPPFSTTWYVISGGSLLPKQPQMPFPLLWAGIVWGIDDGTVTKTCCKNKNNQNEITIQIKREKN